MKPEYWTVTELPFVGRQEVMALYRESLIRALDYKGEILTITGPPGKGENVEFRFSPKTRLGSMCGFIPDSLSTEEIG